MTDSTTTNYGWPYPTVNADAATWGGTWNTSVQAIDAQVKTVDTDAKNASNLTTGTVPDGCFPATLPVSSGVNLTALNASNLSSGTVPTAQIPTTLSGMTFSGTFTLPDSAIWSSSGIAGLAKLGIGMTPANIFDVTQNQDAASVASILNSSSGTSASARFSATNGTHTAYAGVLGEGFSAFGVYQQGYGIVFGSKGLSLTGDAGPILFGANGGGESGRFGTDGSFLVGSTTNAGAGSIAATGNVTAYYSDDRLKTRLGAIDNALDKVLSLNGFYYEANETAQKLGYAPVREVGLSAQDVQLVLPEVTAPAPIDNQYLTLHYERIVPLLVEAIKELNGDIEHVRKYLAL